jgi:hypothetical protein
MRILAVIMAAAALSGCADTDVERDGDGHGYELRLPADVIESRPGLWERAADESAILCPQGFKVTVAADMASDVNWRIRCLQAVVVQ